MFFIQTKQKRDPNGWFWIIFLNLFISLPLSLKREFSALRYVYVIGGMLLAYITIVILIMPFTGVIGPLQPKWSSMK